MTNLIPRSEFEFLMKHNNFVINEGQVVCNLCSGNCGQCGVGRQQSDCQDFVDHYADEFKTKPLPRFRDLPIPSPMVILMSLAAIAHAFVQ